MICENDLIPYNTSALPAGPWLVFSPHPDDETFGMGGSLLLASDQGIEATVVILTDGSLGGVDKAIVAIRRNEAIQALNALGVKKYYFWNLPDRGLEVTDALILKVAEIISEVKPQSVFFPTPMELHPDHRQSAALVWEGLRQASSFTGKAFSYEIGTQGQINYLIDISAVVEKKAQVMALYASQQAVNNYAQIVQSLDCARTYTLPKNVLAAEGFWQHETLSKSLASDTLDNLRPYWQIAKRENPALVSIIVRTKDRPALLQEALQSICEQTYPKIEIIVVNDGGDDVSEIIRRFNGVNTTIVLEQFPVNLGRSKAANAGLDKATGNYIAFLDDDDWLEPGHIDTLVQAIEKHPANKVVYSGVRCVDRDKKPLPDHFGAPFDATLLLAGNYIPIHAALFSRELLKLGCRVDESLAFYEDWDFWIQASMFTNFLFVEEYSAVYRIDNSIQQSGLGLGAKVTDIEKASLPLFHKWLPRLQEDQLVKLMHTVQHKREKDGQIAERDLKITVLNKTIAERDKQAGALNQAIAGRDKQIIALNQTITQHNKHIILLNQAITDFISSTSWRVTSPLRWVGHQIKRIRHLLYILPILVEREGGIKSTLKNSVAAWGRDGKSGIRHLLAGGAGLIENKLEEGQLVDRHDYAEWVRRYDTLNDVDREHIRASIAVMPHRPKISVVMPVFDPPLHFLDEAIWSVRKQLYSDWELCIADDASKNVAVHDLLKRHAAEDARIRVVFRAENGHISRASNSALSLATGEFIALFDNDDLLPEHALFCVAETIIANPNVGIIYSDEDKLSESGIRVDPYFKCDWNPELFLGHNLLSHLGVYRADIVKAMGGFREGFEGSQDYDLAARVIEEITPEQIVHIPRVLYHWRILSGSTAMSIGGKPYALIASEKALNEHLFRRGVKGRVEALPIGLHRLRFSLPENPLLVSIIIPTRNGVDLVRTCVTSIYALTTYKNFEILLVDNGSDDPVALSYFEKLQLMHDNFRVIRDDRPFNFSALNNSAVRQAKGELIALLNNDIEVITPDWLSEMVSIAIQPGIGAVGAKLWYLNNLLQHGGVSLGLGACRIAGHTHHNLPMGQYGYFGRAVLTQELSAVTAACMVVLKKNYLEVGGLNETDLTVAFNDIDFCLKLKSRGYRNVWTPFAELYHHESATRGEEDTPEKKIRHLNEIQYMQQRWGHVLLNDPAYSPNLTLDYEDFGLAWPPRIRSFSPAVADDDACTDPLPKR